VNGAADNKTDEQGANFKHHTTDCGFDICSDGDIARLYYVCYEQHIIGTDNKPTLPTKGLSTFKFT
jgi:hypothetical protein